MKPVIDYAEFYITNVCNLNCDNCNRFNNFHFKGHFKWKDNEKAYKAWAKKVDINRINIIGGEPMLNPDLLNWVKGLNKLWPRSPINIITNGTRLLHWKKKGLINCISKLSLEINNHSPGTKTRDTINEFIKDEKYHMHPKDTIHTRYKDSIILL